MKHGITPSFGGSLNMKYVPALSGNVMALCLMLSIDHLTFVYTVC